MKIKKNTGTNTVDNNKNNNPDLSIYKLNSSNPYLYSRND